MKQEKPTPFQGPIARDLGISEMPKSGAQRGFGRGYTIGFLTCFGLFAASLVALYNAGSNIARVRAAGYVFMSFGAMFTFAVVYTIVTRKGIPWTASAFGHVRTGVLDRRKNALGFWALCTIMLIICSLLFGGGIWIRANAASVVKALQRA